MSCVWNVEGFLSIQIIPLFLIFPCSLSTTLQKNQIFTFPLPAAFPHSKLDCGTRYHTPTLYCNFFCSESIVVALFASHLFNIFLVLFTPFESSFAQIVFNHLCHFVPSLC